MDTKWTKGEIGMKRTVVHIFGCLSKQYGSFERHCLGLARELRHQGWNVVYVYDGPIASAEYRADLERLGVTVHVDIPSHPIKQMIWIRNIIKTNKADVVHVHFSIPRYICAALTHDPSLKFKLVYTRHGETKVQSKKSVFLQNWVAGRTEKILAVSQTVRSNLISAGIEPDNVRVAYLGLQTEAWNRSVMESQQQIKSKYAEIYGIPADIPWIVSTSHFRKGKGMEIFVRMLDSLLESGMRFGAILAGGGELKDSIQAMTRHPKDIKFPGVVPDVRELLAASDLFVFPTDGTEGEGLPMSVIEALAAGCITVSTAVSELPQIINHEEDGYIVEPGSEPALLDAVSAVLNQTQSERETMRYKAERAADKMKLENQLPTIIHTYEEMTG